MFKILLSMMMMMFISILLMVMCKIISMKSNMDREKKSPFECGFDPKSSSRLPFSMQFFLIAVLFLVFDIEIVIILPMIITMKMSLSYEWTMTIIIFIIILILGLIHEWNNSILEWAK
uniref:NADH-ubiquinone oxidoreductase chain 3 n=1 Tax=Helotrephes semiglobosus semiglobosus TaxID=1481668 RepID=A0A059TBN3_9HEMI|nr:NADH dehydrogenase subunit 3 [Helotrephes semiglobosus semiglobosus]